MAARIGAAAFSASVSVLKCVLSSASRLNRQRVPPRGLKEKYHVCAHFGQRDLPHVQTFRTQ
jgi:hypothetical protein